MKFPFFILVVFGVAQNLEAQTPKKLYYNHQWEITTKDSAVYYRICLLDTITSQYKPTFIGGVSDYLMNDQLVMKGSYNAGRKNGTFSFYHSNGQLESEGEFRNDLRAGNWKYYFPDGNPKLDVTFSDDAFFVNSMYDTSGKLIVTNGTGDWIHEYEWYNLPVRLVVRGRFENGEKDGEWQCSTSEGDVVYRETFSKNKFKKGVLIESGRSIAYTQEYQNKFLAPYKFEVTEKFLNQEHVVRTDYPFLLFLPWPKVSTPTDSNSNSIDSSESETIFTVVDEQAEYPGGFDALAKLLYNNLKYPPDARRMGIQGSVFVSFVVNKDGSITDINIIKGIGGGCDQEAIRIVSIFPKWIPGKQNGKAVKSRFVLPIKFKLAGRY